MVLRIVGWSVIGLGAVALWVALLLAALLVAGGLLPADLPWDEALVLLGHGLGWPILASGLAGLGLLQLAERPVGWPGVTAIVTGAAVAGVGGVVTAVPLSIGEGTLLVGMALVALGSATGGLGVLAVAGHQRSWPRPLGGALVAAAVYALGSSAIELWWIVPYTFTRTGDMWIQLRAAPLVTVPVSLLAAGVLAEIAREERAPVALDAVVACGLSVIAAVGLGVSPEIVSAAAFVLTLLAVVAYTVDAVRRRVWQLRASQPSGTVAIAMWAVGLVGMAGVGLLSGDVFFHDTFAELAPGHLLGPMLAGVVLAAGAVDRLRGWSVLPWLGLGCCAVVTGGGVWRIAAGFLALGVEGLPRRYYGYAPDGGTGWLDLGSGLVLFILGLSAATVGSAVWAAARSSGGRGPGRG